MSVYVYAIVDATDLPPAVPRGIGGAPVQAIASGGIAAATSEGVAPPEPTEEALWAHERVVEALMEERTVLPVRFGIALADADRLRAELRRREEELVRILARVRGRVELGVRAVWTGGGAGGVAEPPADGAAGRGTAYLARKLAAERAAAEASARLHDPLARLADESVHEIRHAPELTLAASYLVDRGNVERFRDEAERLAREAGDVRLACTGPWPAYSFSTPVDA